MRFRLVEEYGRYLPVTAHPMESSIDEGPGFELPPIHSSLLLGCPRCPYCGNEAAGVCGCEAILCTPSEPPESIRCPRCLALLSLGGYGDFEINQSAG